MKRRISMLLVLAMLFGILCVPTFAANKNNYGIHRYVAMGDSIATGMNEEVGVPKVPTDELDENGAPVMKEIIGSNEIGYTADVARALNLIYGDDYTSYAYAGMRTNDILYALNGATEEIAAGTVPDAGPSFDDVRPQLLEDIRSADLITLNIGENDIFTIPLVLAVIAAIASQAENAEEAQQLEDAAEAVEQAETVQDAFAGVTNAIKTAKLLNTFCVTLVAMCVVGYQGFKTNFPQILAKYRDLNPNAQIVVLGMFNPVVAFLKNDLLSAADSLDAIVTPANLFMAASCAKYNCTFVGMTDIQIDSSMHPTTAQYQKMADRIVASLNTKTAFTDVSSLSNTFKTAINWAVSTDITAGTSETTFSPNDTCTRAQIVTFLWRMAGCPKAEADVPFTDLAADWYADAVQWAVANGITTGTSKTTFSPDQLCSRAQIVTFLYRYDQAFNPDAAASIFGGTGFRDVSLAAYYGAPVAWAVKNGITNGISSIFFAPLQSCTRAQAVTFLYRYASL